MESLSGDLTHIIAGKSSTISKHGLLFVFPQPLHSNSYK